MREVSDSESKLDLYEKSFSEGEQLLQSAACLPKLCTEKSVQHVTVHPRLG